MKQNADKSNKTPFEEALEKFSNATGLSKAAEIVWNCPKSDRGMYQRYTTLDKALKIIKDHQWLLSRGDIQNDLREAKRSKKIEEKMGRSYLMCLMRGAGENVAMWSLYGNKNPFAVRISIPRATVENKWIRQIVKGCDFEVKKLDGMNIGREKIKECHFRDLIYVAVRDKEVQDEYDIRRTNIISWEGEKAYLGKDDSLFKDSKKEQFAGWIKDYEPKFGSRPPLNRRAAA